MKRRWWIVALLVLLSAAVVLFFAGDSNRPFSLLTDGAQRFHSHDRFETSTRVLFIGNSLTYVNDVPGMVRALSHGEGSRYAIDVYSVTVPGIGLQEHWKSGEAAAAIQSHRAPFVVLQEQSQAACFTPESFDWNARRFAEIVRDSGGTPILYEGWPRGATDRMYRENGPAGKTPEAMFACLTGSFNTVANGARLRPAHVGAAWMDASRERAAISLWDPDATHATASGAYLAACVIYQAISGESPARLTWHPSSVSAEDAAWLRSVAARHK